MIPIVAALAHHLVQKVGARLASKRFGTAQLKQPVVLARPIELERVEPNRAQEQRAPTQELLRRIHESFADGDAALKKLLDSRAVRPEELHALQTQVNQLNDEIDRLTQSVERSLQSLQPHVPA